MKLFYWVIFIILLSMPLVADFVVVRTDVLLRDILFVEGLIILVFGAQSGEYIWKRIRGERNHSTELRVGLAFLAFGSIYILAAILIP